MIIVCIASGPSLTAADVDRCRGANVVVVNDSWRMARWARWLYAADHRWWVSNPLGFEHSNEVLTRTEFDGDRVTCDPGTAQQFGLRYVPHKPGQGLGSDHVRGTLSGIEAINFAVLQGARKIVLLGYDMGATGTGHWFGDHPETVTWKTAHGAQTERMNSATADTYADACREVSVMAQDIAALGIDVVNCTRRTALTCFRLGKIEEEL